jgi:hypothetical protein
VRSSPACWRRGCWGRPGRRTSTRWVGTAAWGSGRRRRTGRAAGGSAPPRLRRSGGSPEHKGNGSSDSHSAWYTKWGQVTVLPH